jgi:hypothetical protein
MVFVKDRFWSVDRRSLAWSWLCVLVELRGIEPLTS